MSWPSFADYGYDTWHCELCHKVVRTYEAEFQADPDAYVAACLDAHREVNCVNEPAVPNA